MNDFEKLGAFYLGKTFDFDNKKINEELLLYDSKDLTTHAVCVGMTGSGKTGLCISLLEEAAIDNIPAIIIDPKGDITNLLLTFPDLKAEDFLPWINESDASRQNISNEEFAQNQAELWKNGLAKWGQSPERITKLKNSAEFKIFTPGSNAGSPVSIIRSFDAPPPALLEDSDLLGDRISTTVSSLLGLLGIDADPIKSREHILISTIIKHFWEDGKNLDLPTLIQSVQKPPVDKIGVFDLDSFFSAKERFELAMSVNNLLSAPSFQSWLEGDPLNIKELLYTDNGKPRISIFSIAHLSDPERMFFMSIMLNEILGWMRQQSGTTSLRAVFYVDEIFGFLPPVANPPSKKPFLTLLKQGRAFGLGLVLATQNPVDLDYKSLSNSGTWFIGRLQTDRDRQRVLDGLEGAATSGGKPIDRKEIGKILSNIDKRVFLLHNVHENHPVIFHTRWAMSYLRGPLTRIQIKKLTEEKTGASTGSVNEIIKVSEPVVEQEQSVQPTLPPDIEQYFLPVRGIIPQGAKVIYSPHIAGDALVYFNDSRKKIDYKENSFRITEITADAISVNWDNSKAIEFDATDLSQDRK